MRRPASTVTAPQLAWLVFYLTICVSPFAFGRILIPTMGRSAWVGMLPSVVTGVIGAWVVVGLGTRFPGQALPGYAQRLVGPIGSGLILAALGVVLSAGAAINLHTLMEVLGGSLLPRVPIVVPAVIGAGICTYAAYLGADAILYLGQAIGFVMVLGLAGILLLPSTVATWSRLLPLGGVPWAEWFRPDVAARLGACRGFLPLLFLTAKVDVRQSGLLWRTLVVILISGLALAASFAVPVAVLGPAYASLFQFPLVDSVSTLVWQWLPFRRYGLIASALWVGFAYMSVSTDIWMASVCWSELAGGARRWFAGAVGVLALGYAAWEVSSARSVALFAAWNWSVIGVGYLAPLGLAVLAAVRRRPA